MVVVILVVVVVVVVVVESKGNIKNKTNVLHLHYNGVCLRNIMGSAPRQLLIFGHREHLISSKLT